MSQTAWDLFGSMPPGWGRVQAITDYVHNRLTFSYQHAGATRTALEAYEEGVGVCRDFAHLLITFCRCLRAALSSPHGLQCLGGNLPR